MKAKAAQAIRGIALLAVLIAAGGVGWVLWAYGARPGDFSQDYFAAKALLQGDSIYGPEVVELGRAHFGTRRSTGNFHPPTLTVFLSPLAFLPYRVAFLVLGIVTVGLGLGSIRLAAAAAPALYARPWWLLALLVWSPFWACLTHGQVSMVVAAALAGSWFCDRRNRPGAAGALAGIAVLLKLFPAVIGLYFLVRKQWRALASMGLVTAGGLAFSWWVVGSEDMVRYATNVAPECAARWSPHPLNVSLPSFVQVLLDDTRWRTEALVDAPVAALWVTRVGGLAILAVTAAIGYRALRHTVEGADRLFGGLCVAALLLSPITWSHTLAVALLPLVVELGRQRTVRQQVFVCGLGLALIGFPGPPLGKLVGPMFAGELVPWYVVGVFQLPAVGLLVLWWRLILLRGDAAPDQRSSVGLTGAAPSSR